MKCLTHIILTITMPNERDEAMTIKKQIKTLTDGKTLTIVQCKILQIVNIPSKAMQFKPIDLISAHKLLQIAAQDIGQLERSFNAISWLYHQLQKLSAALYFMP